MAWITKPAPSFVRVAETSFNMNITAKNIVKDIIIVAVGVAAIWIGLQIVFGTQNPFYVVSSGSMIPVLEVYDVLVVDGKVSLKEIQIGDIIVFNRPNGHDRVIVHRVVAVLDEREESKTVRTKGDANPISIPGTDYPITDEEYIGKVAFVIPQIGYVTRILTPPINYIIIAVIIGIMIVKQYSKSKKHEPKFDSEPQKDPNTEKELSKQDDLEYNDSKFDTVRPDQSPKTDLNQKEFDTNADSDDKDQNKR